jgi:CheY-like chemotaxis protein
VREGGTEYLRIYGDFSLVQLADLRPCAILGQPLMGVFIANDLVNRSRFMPGIKVAKYFPVMKDIILCSSNPILIKSLYGFLRDEGYNVETVEHPALAVQKVLSGRYGFIIVDSEPFGLSAEDAVQIIKTVAPDTPILFVGGERHREHAPAIKTPIDLEEFKRTIHRIAV